MAATTVPTARATLASDLTDAIDGEVRFGDGDRALYSTDASNYRQVPIGVVVPRTVEDIVRTVEICRRHRAPVLARGGGTSLAGQTCNVAVVIDASKYLNRVLALDADNQTARVEPGTVLDDLRAAAEEHHLTFGPDPATHNRCTLGGMIGNNSCGVHSVTAGLTSDNIVELEILTYDGLRLRVGPTSDEELESIIRAGGRRGDIYERLRNLRDRHAEVIRNGFPRIPRRVSGFNLDQLLPENGFNVARALVGTEGTCVTVLEAKVCLVHSPPVRSLVVLGYPDLPVGCDHVPELLGFAPIGLEGFDGRMVRDMRKKGLLIDGLSLLPPGEGWLLVEFGGATLDEAREMAHTLVNSFHGDVQPNVKLFDDPAEQRVIWEVREAALGATAYVPNQAHHWEGWEDSAVPPDRCGQYLRDLRSLLDQYGYDAAFYGHFGQGCLHTRIDFDFVTAAGIAHFNSFINDAANLVVSFGGSLSGEHGDGQARASLIHKMFGPELMAAFREFKSIWDPDNRMNPHKVVDSYLPDENLRLGTEYQPAQPKTHFAFTEDGGSFAQAMLRCVGVGLCRRHEGGTMCPSYMVTREEKDSTRGRARLLFEMLRGNPLGGGWRNQDVAEALDLCLACKGCKGECPVNVDMATYKAEFLSHYYSGRLRPITAYSMGLIVYWARIGGRIPGLVNFMTQTPLLSSAAKSMGGIAAQRRIPKFAGETFQAWFKRQSPQPAGLPKVILWPDTFNNFFHPATARSAVEVLEAAGFQVQVPHKRLCCGRPLYDYGFLTQAKSLLQEILVTLRAEIREGIPIVVLEPSCASVFRDELVNLFPHDEDARRLRAQTFLLSEFLAQHAPDFAVPSLGGDAILHGHCHQKALMGMKHEQALLGAAGVNVETLDSGCCGMAGAFGFERDHYDVSLAVGERVLLPAVRNAPASTLIVTDGFSCQEQIAQTTDRRAEHLADVLARTLRLHGAPFKAGSASIDSVAPVRLPADIGVLSAFVAATFIRVALGRLKRRGS